jgi:polar amino acid transport system substrate-binding protein
MILLETTNKGWHRGLIAAALTLGCWVSLAQGSASRPVTLSPEETAFLEAHPRIVLGTEQSWAPYVIVGEDGHIAGYDAEILSRINTLTGANFQLVVGDWVDMIEAARERRIDGLSTGAVHEERSEYLRFSDVYLSLQKLLLVRQGNPRQIRSRADLDGKRIAIHSGNRTDEKLALEFPRSTILRLGSVDEVIEALIDGDADASFDNGSTLFYAQKLGLPYLEIGFNLNTPLDLVFAVRNDWPEAVDILNKGLAAIDEGERLQIQRKWYLLGGEELRAAPEALALSPQERAYLHGKRVVDICIDPDWMPYERLDAEGRYLGVIADMQRSLAKRLGVEIRIVRTRTWADSMTAARKGRCDIVAGAVATPERLPYLSFSTPYLDLPLVIATRTDESFVDHIGSLLDRRFAVVRKHAVSELLRLEYPTVDLLEVDNTRAGLEAVSRGEAFGFIGTAGSIGHVLRGHAFLDLKIGGKLEQRYAVSVGVHPGNPLLLDIYEKALAGISDDAIEEAITKWSVAPEVATFDYMLLWKMLGVFAVAGGLVGYRYRIEARHNRRLRGLNEQFERLAVTDQLTGLYNRRLFDRLGERELARADREDKPLSLILVDIDHFKRINDAHGHAVGDRVLMQFSRLLHEGTRKIDLLVRWGGEEFVILCADTDLDGTVRLADMLAERIRCFDFGVVGALTASFGIARYRPGEDLEALLKRADEALYRAKRGGRDRVFAESDEGSEV